MATPLFSKQMAIVIDGSILGCATDFSLSVQKDMIEVACLSSTGAKQNVPDLYGWTMSFSGMVQQTKTIDAGKTSFETLMANILSGTDPSVGVYILPDVSANAYWTGKGYLSSLEMTGGIGSAVSFSGEIAGDGALTRATTA
jgi:hypothetical protein